MEYSVKEALEFSKRNELENWIHLFLYSVGNNKALSDGLKLQKRYYIGPVLINLDKLNRCCGPEDDMEFYNSYESWEERINKFRLLIRNGWEMPPLIVENGEKLSIRDGNHRYEALVRENIKKFWVIIWDSESDKNLDIYR